MKNILEQLDNLDQQDQPNKINIIILEDYNDFKEGQIIENVIESKDGYSFDNSTEGNTTSTNCGSIPKDKASIYSTPAPSNPFGVKILVYSEIDGIRQEVLTAHLRGTKPFTAEMVDAFINGDQMLATIRKGMENDSIEMKVFWLLSNA